ncbi:SLAP domain-containing protein [Bacillus nitroreducens]
MQKLIFEAAWDRTISQKDREELKQVFQKEISNLGNGVTFTTVWVAENHKNELLVTAIIHNKTEQHFCFESTTLEFYEESTLLAEHTFTLPSLVVAAETSMPWTFIFPVGSYERSDSIELAELKLKKRK